MYVYIHVRIFMCVYTYMCRCDIVYMGFLSNNTIGLIVFAYHYHMYILFLL